MLPNVGLPILSKIGSALLPLDCHLDDIPGKNDAKTVGSCCIIVTPAPPAGGHLVRQLPVVRVYLGAVWNKLSLVWFNLIDELHTVQLTGDWRSKSSKHLVQLQLDMQLLILSHQEPIHFTAQVIVLNH